MRVPLKRSTRPEGRGRSPGMEAERLQSALSPTSAVRERYIMIPTAPKMLGYGLRSNNTRRQGFVSELSLQVGARQAEDGAHVNQMRPELVQAWDVRHHEERAEVHASHQLEQSIHRSCA